MSHYESVCTQKTNVNIFSAQSSANRVSKINVFKDIVFN